MFDHIFTLLYFLYFFFNDTATTEIYTLSLHDALPISPVLTIRHIPKPCRVRQIEVGLVHLTRMRSEEHTSELQSRGHLVCRLLLEKKKKKEVQQSSLQKIRTREIQSSRLK